MIRFLYTLILILVAPFLLFGLYKKKVGKPRFGSRWKEHFGFTPKLKSTARPLWIHAVSVGESIAAIPIVKELKKQFPDLPILITTTTSTGAQQIEKLGDLVEHRYMPLDFPFAIKKFLKRTNPIAFLIMETELWPNTLHLISATNIPIALLNARLSENSCRKYKKIKPVFDLLGDKLDLVLCQYASDAEHFMQLGLSKDKVKVTGSVKFDITISEEIKTQAQQLRQFLGLSRPVWIAASTHPGEDEQIFNAHKRVLEQIPEALLIIVPRHPERFIPVTNMATDYQFTNVTRSSNKPVSPDIQVYIGDTMGEMLILIGAADICFMGGSLIGNKVGGHNVLEPAAIGKATITGPSYFNFKNIVEELVHHDGCLIINSQEELADIQIKLLQNKTRRYEIGNNAKHYIDSNSGSIQKTIDKLKDNIL